MKAERKVKATLYIWIRYPVKMSWPAICKNYCGAAVLGSRWR